MTIYTHDVMMMYSSTCTTYMSLASQCMYEKCNDVMIYNVTIRWALIRICCEVGPLLCYRQERTSEYYVWCSPPLMLGYDKSSGACVCNQAG